MNSLRIKNILYPLFLIIVVFAVWKYRQSKLPQSGGPSVKIQGITMGTIKYNISYQHPDGLDLSVEIDSLLKVWNQSLSTYIPDSEISIFNRDSCFTFQSKYFLPVLEKSQQVYQKSYGAFDPTVGPLVNAWGFGPEETMLPDSSVVDSLRQFVGFDKVIFDEDKVCKKNGGVQLDFSAIAKGYAVDVVADFIRSKGIKNLLVEIGGELICYGHNEQGNPWRTGIESPRVSLTQVELYAVANIQDMAVATSGNYRNYYVKDGATYSHTIDPATGYPVRRNILSASVFAKDCMTADAYATAFMVLGVERTKEVLQKEKEIEAFIIYTDSKGEMAHFATEKINDKIEIVYGQ